MAYDQLPDYFPDQFDSVWQQLLKQENHVLAGTYMQSDISGDRKRFNQMDQLDMRVANSRAAETVIDERDNFARWLSPLKYEIAERLGEWDSADLGSIVMPTGDIMTNHITAYNRQRDAVCVDALEGNATTGLDGTTLTALPSAQIVVDDFVRSGTPVQSGLTFAKVGRAARILTANHNIKTDRFGLIGSTEEEDLIQDVAEAKNSGDFNVIPTVPDGMIDGKTWYGFNWRTYEYLTTASSITNCLLWQKRMLIFGDGQRKSYVDVLPEHSHALQIRETARMAALRREEAGVALIETYHA
jgi:hypothetical protein